MKICFTLITFAISSFLVTDAFTEKFSELYPRLRPKNESTLPSNFRTSNDSFLEPFKDKNISREGLEKLHASSSGQFSEKSFEYFSQILPKKNQIYFDLRREYHGFLNGCAVSWKLKESTEGSYVYNFELTSEEIEANEKLLLEEALQNKSTVYKTDDGIIQFFPKEAATERQLIEKKGFQYIRLPILDRGYPLDEQVDQFVSIIKLLSDKDWIHFHCAAGEGRSTAFMTMLDMMRNTHLTTLEILDRQEAIGGINLKDFKKRYSASLEKQLQGKKRLEFLELFHKYCRENSDFSENWTSWKSHQ